MLSLVCQSECDVCPCRASNKSVFMYGVPNTTKDWPGDSCNGTTCSASPRVCTLDVGALDVGALDVCALDVCALEDDASASIASETMTSHLSRPVNVMTPHVQDE